MDSFYDDPFGLNSVLGFDLFGFGAPVPWPWSRPILITTEQYREAEEAHQRWLAGAPIRELEQSIQRRFDRCCHR